jgi:hypothetical protein
MLENKFLTYLQTLKIHQVSVTACPHCIKLSKLEALPRPFTKIQMQEHIKKQRHMKLQLQWQQYIKIKAEIQSSLHKVLLVMDFVKIYGLHHSFQILYVIYYYQGDDGEPTILRRSFIGEIDSVYFVIQVFLKYIIPDLFVYQWHNVEIF